MSTPIEQQQAVMRGRKFLEKLIDPGRTPRVPSAVRAEARELLKHYPHDIQLMANTLTTVIEKTATPQYNGVYSK